MRSQGDRRVIAASRKHLQMNTEQSVLAMYKHQMAKAILSRSWIHFGTIQRYSRKLPVSVNRSKSVNTFKDTNILLYDGGHRGLQYVMNHCMYRCMYVLVLSVQIRLVEINAADPP